MGCFDFLKRRRSPKIHPYMDEEEMKDIPPQVPCGKKHWRLGLGPPPYGMKVLFTYPHWKRDRKGVCWIRDNDPIYPCPPAPPPTPPSARAKPLLRPLPPLPPAASQKPRKKKVKKAKKAKKSSSFQVDCINGQPFLFHFRLKPDHCFAHCQLFCLL